MKDKLLMFLCGLVLVSPLLLITRLLNMEAIVFGPPLSFTMEVWQFILSICLLSQIFYWKKIIQIYNFLNKKNHIFVVKYLMPYSRIFPIWAMFFIALLFGKSSLDVSMKFIMLFVVLMPVLFYMVWVDIWCKKNLPDNLNRYDKHNK